MATMRHNWIFLAAAAGAVLTFAGGCGKKPKDEGGGGRRAGAVERAFLESASTYKIPVRYLMAAAWLESRLTPVNATANYVTADSDAPVARGTPMTETAFGMPLATLGLDAAKATSFQLPNQISAYAGWLRAEIDRSGTALAADPKTEEEVFHWLASLAALHRSGIEQRRNVQVIFAKELIGVLNQGFVWQDPDTAERLELTPERRPIDPLAFPENGRSWMTLTELRGQIYVASYLPLVTVPSGEYENHPRRVEVIHCPLSLSACLELQSKTRESAVQLAAHYLIPDDDSVFENVIQVVDHREALVLTNAQGENQPVNDAIIVMLTGNSGRTVDGRRHPALPTWFSNRQLLLMSQVVNDLCTLMNQETPELVKMEECLSLSGDYGVRFRHQEGSEEQRWGDIADYDDSIFGAYIRNPGGLAQAAAFEFKRANREFRAGEDVPLTLLFGANARTIEFERLSRCQDGRVVWEPVRIEQVRSEKRITVGSTLYDGGPNGNGEQFFRARVYGADSRLVGWAIDRILLSGFEKDTVYSSERYCR